MLNNTGMRLSFVLGIVIFVMALTLGGNSASRIDYQIVPGVAASQTSAGYLGTLGNTISGEYFPSAYVNQAPDGDGNVKTYEHG
jgi:hypothetical protein